MFQPLGKRRAVELQRKERCPSAAPSGQTVLGEHRCELLLTAFTIWRSNSEVFRPLYRPVITLQVPHTPCLAEHAASEGFCCAASAAFSQPSERFVLSVSWSWMKWWKSIKCMPGMEMLIELSEEETEHRVEGATTYLFWPNKFNELPLTQVLQPGLQSLKKHLIIFILKNKLWLLWVEIE